jgi:hypothetical protein
MASFIIRSGCLPCPLVTILPTNCTAPTHKLPIIFLYQEYFYAYHRRIVTAREALSERVSI